jgi:hypothetical protein
LQPRRMLLWNDLIPMSPAPYWRFASVSPKGREVRASSFGSTPERSETLDPFQAEHRAPVGDMPAGATRPTFDSQPKKRFLSPRGRNAAAGEAGLSKTHARSAAVRAGKTHEENDSGPGRICWQSLSTLVRPLSPAGRDARAQRGSEGETFAPKKERTKPSICHL